jgi:hypothetical protein
MRKFILIVLLLVSPQSFGSASDAGGLIHSAVVELPRIEQRTHFRIQDAIDAFLKSQDDEAEPVLNAQISELRRAGYTERDSTGAVLLSAGCGFVGCTGTYLVTTAYSTRGANTRSKIVAAVITVGVGGGDKRILTTVEIERLIHSK